MKLIIENKSECNIIEDIIIDYESSDDIKQKEKKEDIKSLVSAIRYSIDQFRIDKNIGMIGPMKCSHCGNEWMAVCSSESKKLRCHKCGKFNLTREVNCKVSNDW